MFAVHIFRSVQFHIVILSQMQLQMKFRMLIPYLFFQVLIFKRHFIISQMYKNFFSFIALSSLFDFFVLLVYAGKIDV